MYVTEEQIAILKPYIANIEELIKNDDVQEVLDAIDDVIIENILGNNDEPDEEGIKIQRIYDQIFNQNLKVYCPVKEGQIDGGDCLIVCDVADRCIKPTVLPTDIKWNEEQREKCINCQYHNDIEE